MQVAVVVSANAHPDTMLTTDEVAAMLRVQPRTLEDWRGDGYGPPFIYIGRHVRYRLRDVSAWIETRKASSTTG